MHIFGRFCSIFLNTYQWLNTGTYVGTRDNCGITNRNFLKRIPSRMLEIASNSFLSSQYSMEIFAIRFPKHFPNLISKLFSSSIMNLFWYRCEFFFRCRYGVKCFWSVNVLTDIFGRISLLVNLANFIEFIPNFAMRNLKMLHLEEDITTAIKRLGMYFWKKTFLISLLVSQNQYLYYLFTFQIFIIMMTYQIKKALYYQLVNNAKCWVIQRKVVHTWPERGRCLKFFKI